MRTMIIAIAIGAALATPAIAQDNGGRAGWGQREQTRQDAQQRADTMFQMLDSNHDGSVTRAEAQKALEQFEAARGGAGGGSSRMQRMLDLAFGSAQSITLQQFETQALARFDAMDLNHDGTVTPEERQQARQQRAQSVRGTAAPTSAAGQTPPGQ